MDRRAFFAAGLGASGAISAGVMLAQNIAPTSSGVSRALAPPDQPIDPRRTAFINVDMQNRFVEGYPDSAPGGPALLRRINVFAVVCRDASLRVIHTAHVLRPDGSNAPMGIPEPAKALLTRGSHASMLHKDLIVTKADTVLEKPRYGAFTGTDLEIVLRAHGIDTVIVGGIATNVCCDTTAREAVARDFRLYFLSDGTATGANGDVSAEQMQRATCATLSLPGFGQVLTLDDMASLIRKAQSAPH